MTISGGPTTVGSAGRAGCSFRTTANGGVSCCAANLGGAPWDASILSRSPPPPPPPPVVPGTIGITYSLSPGINCATVLRTTSLFSTTHHPEAATRASATTCNPKESARWEPRIGNVSELLLNNGGITVSRETLPSGREPLEAITIRGPDDIRLA